MKHSVDPARVALVIRRCLKRGAAVEIDGLGRFVAQRDGSYRFVPRRRPVVFIAYVEEDVETALRLYSGLSGAGFDPWVDKRKLLPGQNWPRSIERVIDTADYFIACFSSRSVSKRGSFHSELRYALDCATRLPLDDVYFIPVRLDECAVPRRISREIQYIDLFPDWESGFRRVVRAIRSQQRRRATNMPLERSA